MREVADSEVLARGKRCMGLFMMDLFIAALRVYLWEPVLARGAARRLDLIWWVSPWSPRSVPAIATWVPFFLNL